MRFCFLVLTLLLFCACSQKEVVPATALSDDFDDFENEYSSPTNSGFDPLFGYNVVMTGFNDAAMRNVIIPVAKGYKAVVPEGPRSSAGNFFENLLYPVRLVNNLLQGKFGNALDETNRFLLNTTVGFLGFADVASDIYKIEEHDEDFGQTLGYWGVPAGPHIVLPILGPSNLRDFSGRIADGMLSPINYSELRGLNLSNSYFESISANTLKEINAQAKNPNMYKDITKDAIDLYPFLRNIYEQRREALIKE